MTGDYIGWSIGIVGLILALIKIRENNKLRNASQQVHNKAKTIIQNNYFINDAPPEVKEGLGFIVANTGNAADITLAEKEN